MNHLAQLPGPKGLPFLGNLLQLRKKKLHLQLHHWSDKYGPYYQFKIGNKKLVVISDIEMLQVILKKRPDSFRRMSSIESVFLEMSNAGVFSSEGDRWKRQRKLIMPIFQNTHYRNFFETLLTITSRLKRKWEDVSQSKQDFEASKDLMRYTVDITTKLAFDYDINTLEKTGDVIQKHLEKILPAIGRRVNAPFPYWRYIRLPSDRAVDQALLKIQQKIDEMIQETRKHLSENPTLTLRPTNLLEALINVRDKEGVKFSDDELFGNIITLLIAGEDTTANVMAWTIQYMIENPRIQEKMIEEAHQVLGAAKQLRSFDDLDKLPYIEAVLFESMRLKSVAPFLFLETTQDFELNELNLSPGTNVVALTQYGALQESNFTSPKEFHPERWLPENRPSHWQHNLKAFMPFGGGARVCPGRSLSMIEMKAVFGMICRNFILEKPLNGKTPKEEFSFIVGPSCLWTQLRTQKP